MSATVTHADVWDWLRDEGCGLEVLLYSDPGRGDTWRASAVPLDDDGPLIVEGPFAATPTEAVAALWRQMTGGAE